jgi:hypothetical protein
MRLTEKRDNGSWKLKGVEWKQIAPDAKITDEVWWKLYEALWKLKDYEDTGVDPDGIRQLNAETQEQARAMLERVAKLSDEIERMKGEKRQRWIPVDERLPELGSLVLVAFERTSKVDIAEYDKDWKGDEGFRPADIERDEYTIEVIAWKPLPEIYREDE